MNGDFHVSLSIFWADVFLFISHEHYTYYNMIITYFNGHSIQIKCVWQLGCKGAYQTTQLTNLGKRKTPKLIQFINLLIEGISRGIVSGGVGGWQIRYPHKNRRKNRYA